MPKITLVLGGARSGKSSLAEKLAQKRAGLLNVLYVATLQPYDDEMRERVVKHQASRPATWRTLEAPFELTQTILTELRNETLVLVDCLAVWSSNRLVKVSGLLDNLAEITEDIKTEHEPAATTISRSLALNYQQLEIDLTSEINHLIAEMRRQKRDLILVSNEVGLGLVPAYPLGRAYRDLLGRLNQTIAAQADETLMIWAGIPVDLKRMQAELEI